MANTLKGLLGQSYKEGMTLDEVDKELEKLELGKVIDENKTLKASLTRSNSEAADYKKQLRAKLSEQEQQEAERKETFEKMQKELEELKHEKLVSDTATKFASAGYDDAKKVAEAYVSGNLDAVLEAQKGLLQKQEDALKAKLMSGTPRPATGGTEPKKITKKELYSMPLEDRMRFIQEHRAEYDALTKEEE